MALSAERSTKSLAPGNLVYKMAAVKIWAGSLVCLSGGYLVPGSVNANLKTVGRAEATVDNSGGAAGALSCEVARGTFLFKNFSSDLVTQADVGLDCYVYDDETVARTSASSARSIAGKVRGIEAGQVWVEILP